MLLSFYRRQSMTVRIVFAMSFGILVGIVFGERARELRFIGDIYLWLLKFCVMPMILTTSISTICNTKDIKTLGRIGLCACLCFSLSLILAGAVGTFFSMIFKPGIGIQLSSDIHAPGIPQILPWQEVAVGFFPENLVQVLLDGNVFLLLFIGMLCGLSIVKMGAKGERLSENIALWGLAVQKLSRIIFSFTPIGVFALMAVTVGQYGPGVLSPIVKLILVYYASCLFWLAAVYFPVVWFSAGITPVSFLKRSVRVILCCIGTCSSTSTIPVNLTAARENFHISPIIANFIVPLGSQINKNGLGLLFPSLYIFACQAQGVSVSLPNVGIVIALTLVLVLCGGNGGLPSGGVFMITMVFSAMGVPLEFASLISGIYRFLDMGMTTMNCLGDLAVAIVLDSLDKKKHCFSLQEK